MKKLKIMLGSAAFLLAVIAAFASKSFETVTIDEQYYRLNVSEQCIETNCDPLNTGTLCEFTVYKDEPGQAQCNTPFIEARRPN